MPISNIWILRALAVRLRQPGMRPQRRFVAATSLLMALFVAGAVIYLLRQPTEDALEHASLRVFAAMGVLIVILIASAVVVRKRTGVTWSQEEALRAADEGREGKQQPKSRL